MVSALGDFKAVCEALVSANSNQVFGSIVHSCSCSLRVNLTHFL
jgi:hypothetical protein